jgi:hypothetical protein
MRKKSSRLKRTKTDEEAIEHVLDFSTKKEAPSTQARLDWRL